MRFIEPTASGQLPSVAIEFGVGGLLDGGA
jgi:hypothetical protein